MPRKERTLTLKSRNCVILNCTDKVNGYHLSDPTGHEVIIRDVIVVKDLQNDGSNSTGIESSETIGVQVKDDSSKATPEHDEQVPVQFEPQEI